MNCHDNHIYFCSKSPVKAKINTIIFCEHCYVITCTVLIISNHSKIIYHYDNNIILIIKGHSTIQ